MAFTIQTPPIKQNSYQAPSLRVISSSPLSTPPTITTTSSTLTAKRMPGAVISNATRIWELNVHWPLYSQCGVWDARGRGVDIWECVRDHASTPGTQPPNAVYWRYVARR